jgi:putative ABC transport system ATP-binding protein
VLTEIIPTPQTTPSPAARAVELTKTYGTGETAVTALAGVTVGFDRGRFTAVMGPSGSGKSTLMHCVAGLDAPTSGHAFIGDQDIGALADSALTELRRDRIGFVFQAFNLVPTLTAAENITLPADLAGIPVDEDWLDQIVASLRIADRLTHRPSELSGGQQQRVACARALVTRPELIFADEPTGNLDSAASEEVLKLLRRAVDTAGQTVVMVTHDAHAAAIADRILFLSDGRIVRDLPAASEDQIIEAMKTLGV